MKIAVLGASGGVGSRIVQRAVAQGHEVVAQSRDAERLAGLPQGATGQVFDPRDEQALRGFVEGADAVVFALGTDRTGRTTLFSEVTRALLEAMRQSGCRRLLAITGVGAGETRGHGGFLYDRLIFPLFTRQRYADKDRQEALIAASDRDWIIVRPAPFSADAPKGALEVHTRIEPGTVLRRVTRDEVARFVVEQLDSDRYLRQRPFIGHP